jgi:hypothetical protein
MDCTIGDKVAVEITAELLTYETATKGKPEAAVKVPIALLTVGAILARLYAFHPPFPLVVVCGKSDRVFQVALRLFLQMWLSSVILLL